MTSSTTSTSHCCGNLAGRPRWPFSAARHVVCGTDGAGGDEAVCLPIRARCGGACTLDIEIGERAELHAAASGAAAQESSFRICRRRFAQRESGDPVPLGPQACVRGSSRVLQKRERVTLLLGAIADDFTGATDLANTLVRGGMRTIQTIGVPEPGAALDEADAIVVALKSRSIPADEAVRLSLEALDALQERGASKFIFKYCSTFDSTDHGNIGPVADALLDRLGSEMTIFCPAFPENGRRLFNGYLFVGDVLLSESGMEKHPITPMTDPNLVRVLGRQTKHKVGKIDLARVRRGEAAVRTAIMEARGAGVRHLVVDAVATKTCTRLAWERKSCR